MSDGRLCTWQLIPLESLSLLSLTRCTLYTTLYYTIMTSLSQRLLHTSLPHRIYTKLGARSFSVSSSNFNQNPTPSDLAHQARLLIQDAPEAVVEPERKFQANQVCSSLYPLNWSLPPTRDSGFMTRILPIHSVQEKLISRSTPHTHSPPHPSTPHQPQTPDNHY